jgi:pilus assembly protein CpaC
MNSMLNILIIIFFLFRSNLFLIAADNDKSIKQHNSENRMVEVAVEVIEINDNKAEDLGIEWPNSVRISDKDPLPQGIPSIFNPGEWPYHSPITATLHLLQDQGAAQILSKPKVLALSGTTATFVVGGQIPIPVTGPQGSVSVDWKEYGIIVSVSPNIKGDFIETSIQAEVSRLDWTNKVNGYPAVYTRRTTSNVRVQSGQTVTLAGMLETNKIEANDRFPFLSKIPLLGWLFFSRKTLQEKKSNVLIFVTPVILTK